MDLTLRKLEIVRPDVQVRDLGWNGWPESEKAGAAYGKVQDNAEKWRCTKSSQDVLI